MHTTWTTRRPNPCDVRNPKTEVRGGPPRMVRSQIFHRSLRSTGVVQMPVTRWGHPWRTYGMKTWTAVNSDLWTHATGARRSGRNNQNVSVREIAAARIIAEKCSSVVVFCRQLSGPNTSSGASSPLLTMSGTKLSVGLLNVSDSPYLGPQVQGFGWLVRTSKLQEPPGPLPDHGTSG